MLLIITLNQDDGGEAQSGKVISNFDLSLDEISKIVNIDTNTIKVTLFRARKKLAVILEQYLELQKELDYG